MSHLAFIPLLTLFSFIWSSAFIAGKIALHSSGPLSVLCLRFFLSAALLFLCIRDVRALGQKKILLAALPLGLLNNTIYLSCAFSALRFISPAWVTIIVSCAPFITAALLHLLSLETLKARNLTGMLTAFCGILFITGLSWPGKDFFWGAALALCGTTAFSAGTIFFRYRAAHLPIVQLNFWQSLSGAFFLLPAAWLTENLFTLPDWPSTLAIIYLALIVSIGGMALWFIIIRRFGAGPASMCHLLNPVFGFILSSLVLNTPFKLQDLCGASLVGLGLLLALWNRPAQNRPLRN